ncbi:MAG: hypothetical protein H0X39_02735 [Actinobacteria bacterium]|nr:hypothetical protein [Actinomycetota bacterium]
MKGLVALVVAAVAALALAHDRPHADATACGIPTTAPIWVDYAGHSAPIIPKPGMILAVSSGTVVPAELRTAGAATVFFDLHLNDRVGTTAKPADPATIPDKAKRLFDFAVSVSGCDHPLIAENELFGAQTPTPWSDTNAQYRANVLLLLLQELGKLGATPAITIANPPYTGGEAADWWRAAAKAAILIRQVYFTAPGPKGLFKLGPEAASRSMRKGMRGLVAHFSEIGIPASRVALELQFQSAAGQGGRQGLQPRSAWLEIVKLEALAARQVAADMKISGIWSWGWPSFSTAGDDPDKAAAACVYLWARDSRLCDGPTLAGPGFNTSLTEGQISLPKAVRCTFGTQALLKSDVGRAASLTGDLNSAATALLGRTVLRAEEPVDTNTVLAAERAIVRDRFGGSGVRYRAALGAAQITLADARKIITDRLARDRVEERFRPPAATAGQIEAFRSTYAATSVRLVSAQPAAPWLGDASRGFAVETIAPEQAFTLPQGKRTTIDTIDGRFAVRALGPPLPLLALAPQSAIAVARGVLGRFAKDAVYQRWLVAHENVLIAKALCARDDVPAKGDVDLTAWAPFLGS